MVFLALLILVILWIVLDFYIGSRSSKKESPANYPKRLNDLELITEGTAFFSSFTNEIQDATKYIHIQFYIFKKDTIGTQLLDLLYKKVAEGVEVKLLLDFIGSRKLKRKYVRDIRSHGVDLAFMNRPKFPFFFYTLNRRNHRKITIIDGQVAFAGGYNVGDEYLGKSPKLGYWRDYHLKIRGESVNDLQEIFLNDWNHASKIKLRLTDYPLSAYTGTVPMRVLPTNGEDMQDFFLESIHSAKKSIKIGTPYYIPGEKLNAAIVKAAKRGVKVEILLPAKADHFLVKEAAFPYFPELLQAGCTIYRFYQGFYHAKVFIIDDKICDIGTANFDKRSMYLNREVNCLIYCSNIIESVEEAISKDFNRSEILTMQHLNKRSILEKGKELLASSVSGLL